MLIQLIGSTIHTNAMQAHKQHILEDLYKLLKLLVSERDTLCLHLNCGINVARCIANSRKRLYIGDTTSYLLWLQLMSWRQPALHSSQQQPSIEGGSFCHRSHIHRESVMTVRATTF